MFYVFFFFIYRHCTTSTRPDTLSPYSPLFRSPLLASGPIEIQMFGQENADDAIAAVASTFVALPQRNDLPGPAANKLMRFPAHVERPVILRHKGDKEQAAAVMAWPTAGGFPLTKEARQMEQIGRAHV